MHKIFKTKFVFIGIIFLIANICHAGLKSTDPQPKNQQESTATIQKAIVKILSMEGDKIGSSGTGFFISPDGLLLTNYHVMQDIFLKKQRPLFILPDQKQISEATIIRCSDSRNIDICLIKVPYGPSSWFEVVDQSFNSGDMVYTIGNTWKDSFELKLGTVLKKIPDIRSEIIFSVPYEKNQKVEMIQISLPLEAGFSGGPIFDKNSSLVGMGTMSIYLNNKNKNDIKNLAISITEVKAFVDGKITGAKYENFQTQFSVQEVKAFDETGEGTITKLPDGRYQSVATRITKEKALKATANAAKAFCTKNDGKKATITGERSARYILKDGKYTTTVTFFCI